MSLPWRHFVPESSRGGTWGSAAGPKLHQLRVFSPGRNTKRTFILNQQFVSRNPEPVCMSLTCSGPDRWTQFFSPVDILFVRLEMRLQWGKETEPSRTDPVSADDGFTATEWEDEAGSVGSGVFVPESRRQLRTRWVLTGSVTLHQFGVYSSKSRMWWNVASFLLLVNLKFPSFESDELWTSRSWSDVKLLLFTATRILLMSSWISKNLKMSSE